jgi:hypothetical protein
LPRIPPELCAKCKGYKRLCGLPKCPILEMFRSQVQAAMAVSKGPLEGSTPPSTLVGEGGYPRVRVYYMIPPEVRSDEARVYDDPALWAESREPLSQIIRLRSSLVSATLRVDVRSPERLYELELTPAALSSKPVDSEAELAKPPTPRLSFDGVSKPLGPRGPARRIRVIGNPLLPRRLDQLLWDDARAEDAVVELYRSGIDVYTIQRALSLGALGRLRNRRLVPTRWAITAVDDTLSAWIRRKLRGAETLDAVEVYSAEYLGNKFTVILYPGAGHFEWVEAWHPATVWTRSGSRVVTLRLHEDPMGRRTADDGGFSAARFAVLEGLYKRGRIADVVIIREITPSYYAPVGNWHIRETVRRALRLNPIKFDDLGKALEYALSLHQAREQIARASPLIRSGRRQRSLEEYRLI